MGQAALLEGLLIYIFNPPPKTANRSSPGRIGVFRVFPGTFLPGGATSRETDPPFPERRGVSHAGGQSADFAIGHG